MCVMKLSCNAPTQLYRIKKKSLPSNEYQQKVGNRMGYLMLEVQAHARRIMNKSTKCSVLRCFCLIGRSHAGGLQGSHEVNHIGVYCAHVQQFDLAEDVVILRSWRGVTRAVMGERLSCG